MKRHHVVSAVATAVTVTAAAAADLPYAGKWKMNPAKSDFGELTVTYEHDRQ